MWKQKFKKQGVVVGLTLAFAACKAPLITQKTENRAVPTAFNHVSGTNAVQDSVNVGRLEWRAFFTDPNLAALIDTALHNNQELNIMAQEIQIVSNEVAARRGDYLPFVRFGGRAGAERAGRYTLQGATEEEVKIRSEKSNSIVIPNFMVGAFASWEVDIWRKLRNARQAAATRYLATVEGRNFTITNLVSEIAMNYNELLALDNQLANVTQTIDIQKNALNIVKMQKEAARVTELAVRRFEAQVLHTQALQYDIQQKIVEAENRINFLVGRYPQPVQRTAVDLNTTLPEPVFVGAPANLLTNRPDIKQAELNLAANKIDVQVARANFLPSLSLDGALGLSALNPVLLISRPESILLGMAANMMGPWINRIGITANYYSANNRQTQAVYNYERTVLNAYTEVSTQLSKINNLKQGYDLKAKQVQALTESVGISNTLFRSARADYMKVLLTQREALEAKFELIEMRMEQFNARVAVYRALGGGWQ
jgi:outer membrane protein, multidrug efflux system